jgi:lipopolysaccharide export system permease protein
MRILDRYVGLSFLRLLCLGSLALLGVYLVVDLLENLPKFVEARAPAGALVAYYLLSFPRMILQVTPMAVLLAAILCLGTLGRNHELLAMQAGGLSHLRVALPVLVLAAAVSAAALGFGERVLPGANQRASNIQRVQVRRLPPHAVTRANHIWYAAKGGKLLYIGAMDPESGALRDLTVFEFGPGFRLARRLDAPEVAWRDGRWLVLRGIERTFGPDGALREVPAAGRDAGLAETPRDFRRVERLPEEMSYAELRRYIRRLAATGLEVRRYRVDLYAKPALAAASLITALIGVSLGLRVRKAGLTVAVGLSVCLGLAYWVVLSLGLSLGHSGAMPPVLAAWLPNGLFGGAGLLAIWRVRA